MPGAYTPALLLKQRVAGGLRPGCAQHARLVVRRVRQLDPQVNTGQGELLAGCRYHAFVTDTTFTTVEADLTHRARAVIEQVFADLIDGPLAHLPSGRFAANGAWLICATIAHNLTRATAP